jgi:maltoporin
VHPKTIAALVAVGLFLLSAVTVPLVRADDATPPPEPTPPPTPPAPKAEALVNGELGIFRFGSYGRVQATTDFEGHRGRDTNIVAHGPRIFEPAYAELDLAYYLDPPGEFGSKILFTLALFEPLAHYSGDFDQIFAVRNLYAEVWGFLPGVPWLHLWGGSRMYRGDDVYLLDYWPLDNLNTYGGGLIFRWQDLDVRVHAGVSRLTNDYQFQTIEIPGAVTGTEEKVVLDRQRTVASGRATYDVQNIYRALGLRFRLYGEYHNLPKGERIPPELIEDNAPIYQPDTILEKAPADDGWSLGGQLGLFGFGPRSHINLFFRWSQDLAAYGETGVPWGTNDDGTAAGATEMVAALSFNWESRWVGVLAGGYLRRFIDADVNRYDVDDYFEGAVAVRPVVFITDHLQQGLEFGYQQHYPFGLDPGTNEHEVAEVFQYSAHEIVSLGRGNYERPQFRLTYTLSQPNESARRTYPEGDTRRARELEHFLGFGVEWWFNSSTH